MQLGGPSRTIPSRTLDSSRRDGGLAPATRTTAAASVYSDTYDAFSSNAPPLQLPPPSTLAAQIVSNHAQSAAGLGSGSDSPLQSEAERRAVFGRLLEDYLNDPEKDEETDVGRNAVLLSVVAESGLDVLFKTPGIGFGAGDGTASGDAALLIPQALSTLTFIRTVIGRNPKVLFFQPSAAASGGSDSKVGATPVVVWLFSKLARLAGASCYGLLRDGVRDMLLVCIHSLVKTPDTWEQANLFQDFLCMVAEDALASLNTQAVPAPMSTLPSDERLRHLWPHSQTLAMLPRVCRTEITSQEHLWNVALACLEAVGLSQSSSELNLRPTFDRGLWCQNTLSGLAATLESISVSWGPDAVLQKCGPLISLSRSIAIPSAMQSAISHPASIRLALALQSVFAISCRPSLAALQISVAECLLDLWMRSLQEPALRNTHREALSHLTAHIIAASNPSPSSSPSSPQPLNPDLALVARLWETPDSVETLEFQSESLATIVKQYPDWKASTTSSTHHRDKRKRNAQDDGGSIAAQEKLYDSAISYICTAFNVNISDDSASQSQKFR